MNKLEEELYRVVDLVVSNCVTHISETNELSLTREEVLGKSRKENVVLTRCILARMLSVDGFSKTTIAQLLGKTEMGITKMFNQHENYFKVSKAYRIAYNEIKSKLNIN